MSFSFFYVINTLRPEQNGRHLSDIFNSIFLKENSFIFQIFLQMSLKLIPTAYVQLTIYTCISIGPGNGLAPKRQQAFSWTNDDQCKYMYMRN